MDEYSVVAIRLAPAGAGQCDHCPGFRVYRVRAVEIIPTRTHRERGACPDHLAYVVDEAVAELTPVGAS